MRSKIPTILGVLILIIGTAAGIILVASSKQFRLGASPDTAPQDVRVTNITASSFTISWITDKPTIGYIKYGTSNSNLNQITPAPQVTQTVHWLQITSLNPQTQYFFKINSDGTDLDNSGIPWETTTAPQISGQPSSAILSGSVEDAGGLPVSNAVVYVNATNVSPLSAVTSANGSWLIPLNIARTSDLGSYATINPQSTLLQIFVQAGINGVATAQIYPQSGNPTPTIQLGQTYDFRNQPASTSQETPGASLSIPSNATGSAGFNLNPIATPSGSTAAVTVTSIKNGETIATTKPQIIGSGRPGTRVTLTLKSTPQGAIVTIGPDGTWVWTPPANLDPGTHTLTVSWTDAAGVLQSLTRTFTVKASEGPAFVSTPSATLIPLPTPTPTPFSTQSGTTRISLPSTQSAVPVSGTLTPTLALSMMGIGLVFASFILWKKVKI